MYHICFKETPRHLFLFWTSAPGVKTRWTFIVLFGLLELFETSLSMFNINNYLPYL